MTYVDIAKEIGCTRPCVRYWCDDQARAENHQRMSVNSTARNHKMAVKEEDKGIITALYALVIRWNEQHGTDYEVDHIIPACHGGEHRINNLRIVTMRQNRTGRQRETKD